MTGQPPLSIAGRSPFDPIRLRWGGLGGVLLGIAIAAQGGPGAIIFGVLFIALGITTWAVTGFGSIPFRQLSAAKQGIVGTGSIIGLIFIYTVFFCFFATWWLIRVVTSNR